MIFLGREGHHIADAAVIEIAGMAVVDRMGPPPDVVRRERHNAQPAPDPVAQRAVAEKGPVTAIVLDAEEPEQEAPVQRGNEQGAHIAVMRDPACKNPERNERDQRDHEFKAAAQGAGFAVAC